MKNAKCKMLNGGVPTRPVRDLSDRLLAFAVRTGKAVNALPATRLGRHVAAQLVRSGTSAAPNYEEGCAAESRADFVHKLSISLKELRESRFWIRLIVESGTVAVEKDGGTARRMRPTLSDTRPIHRHREEEQRDGKPVTASARPFCILHFAFFILHSSLWSTRNTHGYSHRVIL